MHPYQVQLNIPPNYTKAQTELHKAAIKFLSTHKEEKLTVSKLCKVLNMSRSTFYLYYSSIYELLTEIEDEWLNQLLILDKELTNPQRRKSEDFNYFSEVLDFIDKNLTFINAFLINNYNLRLVEKWKAALKQQFWCRLGEKEVTSKQDFLFEVVAATTLNSYIYYAKNKNNIPRQEIYAIIAKTMKFLKP